MNILALEVSTSSAKALIYSTDDGIISSDSILYNKSISNVVSQDPEGIFNTVLDCASNVLKKAGCNIDIIGLASTWHSFLLLDEKRRPLGKIKSWANTESSSKARKYRQDQEFSQLLYHKTGCPIHSIYPLWEWLYIRDKISNPEGVYLSSKPEYIFERLTGEIAVSKNVASGTGLMNIHTLDWDEEILEFAGLSREQLAPLYEYDYHAYLKEEVADKLALPSGIPVVITGSDGALNQVGSGALKEGIMTLSVGTSGALRMITPQVVLPDEPTTWCYYLGDEKRIAGAATSGAGNCIEWFKDKINRQNMNYKELENLASRVNQELAPFFLPFLYGERCPGWQDNRTAGFYGLRDKHSTGALYYAVLEGILFNLYHSYKILLEVGDYPDEIRVSGGINNSDYWLQMLADIFQRDITISNVKDASTMGAVAIAEKVMGAIERLEDFDSSTGKKKSYNPEKALLYKKRFAGYLKWYQAADGN
ncbi:MAG: hypothetical protein FH762_10670 [Firmicutes bacterium]|nr:hypothetical protein [Bacillota bacterium]